MGGGITKPVIWHAKAGVRPGELIPKDIDIRAVDRFVQLPAPEIVDTANFVTGTSADSVHLEEVPLGQIVDHVTAKYIDAATIIKIPPYYGKFRVEPRDNYRTALELEHFLINDHPAGAYFDLPNPLTVSSRGDILIHHGKYLEQKIKHVHGYKEYAGQKLCGRVVTYGDSKYVFFWRSREDRDLRKEPVLPKGHLFAVRLNDHQWEIVHKRRHGEKLQHAPTVKRFIQEEVPDGASIDLFGKRVLGGVVLINIDVTNGGKSIPFAGYDKYNGEEIFGRIIREGLEKKIYFWESEEARRLEKLPLNPLGHVIARRKHGVWYVQWYSNHPLPAKVRETHEYSQRLLEDLDGEVLEIEWSVNDSNGNVWAYKNIGGKRRNVSLNNYDGPVGKKVFSITRQVGHFKLVEFWVSEASFRDGDMPITARLIGVKDRFGKWHHMWSEVNDVKTLRHVFYKRWISIEALEESFFSHYLNTYYGGRAIPRQVLANGTRNRLIEIYNQRLGVRIDFKNRYSPFITWSQYQALIIAHVLRYTDHRVTYVARLLGIDRSSLRKLIRKYELTDKDHPIYRCPFRFTAGTTMDEYKRRIFAAAYAVAKGMDPVARAYLGVSESEYYGALKKWRAPGENGTTLNMPYLE